MVMIIGHGKVLNFFEEAIKHNSLAQVYCIIGTDQIGKRTVARTIAGKLLGVDSNKLESHPDFIYVERLEDEKTGKLKKDLSVTQARDLRQKLERRSWLGGYSVAIINEAEKLNDQSSNALLKALEEPAAKTVIFLLAKNEADILPTVRSRSQLIFLSPVSNTELETGLREMNFEEQTIDEAVAVSFGRPGFAIVVCENEEFRQELYNELKRFTSLINKPFYEKSKLLEDLFKEKDDGERQRDRIQGILDMWLIGFHVMLLKSLGIETSAKNLNSFFTGVSMSYNDILLNMQKVIEAKAELRYNVNQRLLIEHCILSF